MRDIGKNIRQLREEVGLTQEALAEKLFVTRQTVSNYENGRTRPDLDMLIAIAEALHADVTHILYGVPVPPDRKRLIRQLITGGVISVLLIAALAVLTPMAQDFARRRYLLAPVNLLRCLLAPVAFLTLGWTLTQLSVVLGVKPPRKPWCRTVKIILLLILLFLALNIVPFLLWQTWCGWQVMKVGEVQSSYPFFPVHSQILVMILKMTKEYATTLFACLPYGAAIRWFGFYQRQTDT